MLAADDTIVAIATPPGQGGIGIVRVSGPLARPIAGRMFTPDRPGAVLRTHHLVHGTLRDPARGTVLDEAMVCWMAGPHSYTGEDVVEFHCHGSPALLQRILEACMALGARLAQRGEFTLRAFLQGRIDLAQAEAVMALVSARTPTAAQVAAAGVTGALKRALAPAIQAITGAVAYLEATIDFTEEDLPEQAAPELAAQVAGAREALQILLRRAQHGSVLRDGVRVVLAGKPNVGKSSLLNTLLRRDRAIVTAVAGTTRDTLEETADIHGLPVVLIDTAGLTDSTDPVERLGIARSSEALRSAALVAMVVDASAAPTNADAQAVQIVRAAAPETPLLLVCNKADRTDEARDDAFLRLFDPAPPATRVRCSALTGQGIPSLEDAIADLALNGEALDADATVVESTRQRRLLAEAVDFLVRTEEGLSTCRAPELVAIDLRAALESLGAISGLQVSEAVLDAIFSQFCIGK